MKQHLEKLRNKPEEHKQRIVKTSAFIATGIIIVMYILILSLTSDSKTTLDNQQENKEQQSFLQGFESTFSEIGSSVGELTDKFKAEQESLTELLESENQDIQVESEVEIEQDSDGESQNQESLPETENQN